MMKYLKIVTVTIAVVVLLTLMPTSCRKTGTNQSAADSTSAQLKDSAYWEDVAFNLRLKAVEYYNASQTDSLEAFVPGALKTCLEHGLMDHYYGIWGQLAEEYAWDNEFDKAVAEAQRIEEDAQKRHNEQGLFTAYNVLGIGHLNSQNFEEAVKYFRKAITHFHSKTFTALSSTYNYMTEALNDWGQYEAMDSALAEWKVVIDKNYAAEGTYNYEPWMHCKFQYFCLLALNKKAQKKYTAAEAAADSMDFCLKAEGDLPFDHISAIQLRSGLARERHDDKTALRYAEESLRMSEEMNDNSTRKTSLKEIEQSLEGMGRYQEALETRRKLDAFKDSLTEVDNREQLNELNKRFEVNELKMQAERDQMQAEHCSSIPTD